MLDYLIQDASIIDGTGRAAFHGDVGITGDRISAVGDLRGLAAHHVIHAEGMTVTPGFIDSHAHSDRALPHNQVAHSQVAQGVTTEVAGHCGQSAFPVLPYPLPGQKAFENAPTTKDDFWKDTKDYFRVLREQGMGMNLYPILGHGTVRAMAVGMDNRPVTEAELRQMKAYVVESMELGVRGLSTGLVYSPCMETTEEEILALAQVVSAYGGIYTTHMRHYQADFLEEDMAMAVRIAQRSGLTLEISHIAPQGLDYEGRGGLYDELLTKYRAAGVDVRADTLACPTLGTWWAPRVLFPKWLYDWKAKPWEEAVVDIQAALRDPAKKAQIVAYIEEEAAKDKSDFVGQFLSFQSWKGILLEDCGANSKYRPYIGKTVDEIAREVCMDPAELYFDMILEDGEHLSTTNTLQWDEDKKKVVQSPHVMFGSDNVAIDPSIPRADYNRTQFHPRNFGHMVYIFETLVNKLGWLTPEQAVHKITGLPAMHYNLPNRGLIRSGYQADVVVCSLPDMHVRGDYIHPVAYPAGIEDVFVNGILTYTAKGFVGDLGGVALLRNAI